MKASSGGQHVLNLQTIQTGHRNIQYGASGDRHIMLIEEYPGGGIRFDLISPGAEESRQPLEDSLVIVDEVNCEFVRHAVSKVGCWTGNESFAIAPPPSPLTRVSFP